MTSRTLTGTGTRRGRSSDKELCFIPAAPLMYCMNLSLTGLLLLCSSTPNFSPRAFLFIHLVYGFVFELLMASELLIASFYLMVHYVVSSSWASTVNSPTLTSSNSNSQERQERESYCSNMQSCILKIKGHNLWCWQPIPLKKVAVGVREKT